MCSQGFKTPPQSPPTFDVTPSQLLQETLAIIDTSNELQDALAHALTVDTATFNNLLLPLLHDDHAAAQKLCVYRLFNGVSEDADLRDASRKAEQLRAKSNAESLMRRDIAELVAAVHHKYEAGENEEGIDAEAAHMLFKTHRAYQNAGAGIGDDALRVRYMEAVEERNQLVIEAKKTLSETDQGVWFKLEELYGVSADTLDTMEKSDDGTSRRVTFKKGHWIPVMKYAKSSKTRKTLHIARQNRYPENVERLEKLVALRDELASILGFESHAALKMQDKMASSVDSVASRLTMLKNRLEPVYRAEMETLLAIKTSDVTADNDDQQEADRQQDDQDEARLNAWDWSFYARILEKDRYSVDAQLISQYFELSQSLEGMLTIIEILFGMQFAPADDAPAWQEHVRVFAAWDSEELGGEFLGYFYLDMFAREGKFQGAHCSLIQPGFTKPDGTRHYPASSLICSFIHSPGKPTLLQHSELKTMFHELGHAIHKLVARTRYSHGCARDFVEIPSILFESWIWVPDVLVKLGRHYSFLSHEFKEHWLKTKQAQDEGHDVSLPPPEMLPRQLAEDLARTKHVNGAHAMLHQVFLALFDLTIHGKTTRDGSQTTLAITDIWNTSKAEVMKLHSHAGIGQASFAHPFRGYDASYFTYALSKVYATDMWVSAFKDDPMNKEAGQRYRRIILEPGGSRPEGDLLREFLCREPSEEAYHGELASALSG